MKEEKRSDEIFLESVDRNIIRSQIFEIRGFRVMLDKDIAGYFGVETKALNKAMKRNIERFPDSFCFQITHIECSRCQIGTLNKGRGSNLKYLPFVYTEQGIAMLTSCLHSERAIAASIQIMEAFVEMSHYLQQSRQLMPYHVLSSRQDVIEAEVREIRSCMVTKNDLPDLMELFDDGLNNEEILILNGQPFKADLAYQEIFAKARKSVVVIDDYIGIKTLYHLAKVKQNISVTIITDNKAKALTLSEYSDYLKEYPKKMISFVRSSDKIHDRYIVLDHDTDKMKIYHCGASIKDGGNRITTIMRINDVSQYRQMIKTLLSNPVLKLK